MMLVKLQCVETVAELPPNFGLSERYHVIMGTRLSRISDTHALGFLYHAGDSPVIVTKR